MCEQVNKSNYHYLIGFETTQININKLPSYRDVLSLFIYKHQSLKITIRTSATSVISDTNSVWKNFMIPTIRSQHSIQTLETFFSEYLLIKKHREREKSSKKQRTNVEKFWQKLDKLFDISNSTAVKNLPEDLQQFLYECQNGKVNIHLPVTSCLSEQQRIPEDKENDDKNDIGKK